MANTAQATKRAEQSQQRAERNGAERSKLRTAIKKTRKDVKETQGPLDLKAVTSLIDKNARKGMIHKNKAARLKSRMNRSLKAKTKG